jgi:hypothetical protein
MQKYSVIFVLMLNLMIAQAQKPIQQWSFNARAQVDSLIGELNYVDGVQGKALVFDGYSTEIFRKTNTAPQLGEAFSISAWVAPQEYSWNLSAIINQQKDLKTGYFFGINHVGKLVGSVAVGAEWKSCISNDPLPLLKWSQVTMVFDAQKGISLYINSKKAGETLFTGNPVYAKDTEICFGKTQTKMTPAFTERGTSKAISSWMRFDGLMDEIQIFNQALTDQSIENQFESVKINPIQPLQYRKMPSGTDEPRPFGAYYTQLKFSPGWDELWRGSDLPDIVIRFDNSPVKLIFWRGTGYIPAMVTENGIWMTDQSVENFGTGECYEAMGDKQCRYSNVRIIENTPARVVIHWRYALAGIRHQIYNETETKSGEWVDEYWTAYPDGVVVRNQVLWSDFDPKDQKNYQFQETIFFNQPGTKPQDNVNYEAITFADLDGNKSSYSWENGAPKKFDLPKYQPVQLTNTKSKYKPYGIYYPERVTYPFNFGWVDGYSTFPCWNHWPVSQVASDGRNTVAPDKPSHSSLTQVNCDHQIFEQRPDHSVRVRSIMGMTTDPIDSLLPLARSWNFPPEAKTVSTNFKYTGYDPYQRAYLFEKSGNSKAIMEFEILASKNSPVANLPLVIKNWNASKASVEVNGIKKTMGKDYFIGSIPGLENDETIVFIKLESSQKLKIRIF